MKLKVLAGIILGVAFAGSASALTITAPFPINDPTTGTPDPNCTGIGTGTDPAFIAASCNAMSGLTQVYKFDLPDETPGGESGDLDGSYESTYNGDASGGTITWVGPQSLLCTIADPCWLLVKDGNQTPGRYAYNLTGLWDGLATITLTGFWPENGSISHWALYGGICRENCDDGDEVPEPGTLALLGLGLLGLAVTRRRIAK